MANKYDSILGEYRQSDIQNLSAYLKLDQTTPQTFSAGTVTGTGLLKVTAGLLGLDTNTYLTSLSGALLADGTTPLTANWNVGAYALTMNGLTVERNFNGAAISYLKNADTGASARSYISIGEDTSSKHMGFGYSNTNFSLGAGYEMLAGPGAWMYGSTGANGVTIISARTTGYIRFAVGGWGNAYEKGRMTTVGLALGRTVASCRLDISTGSNALGLRLRGLTDTVEIADFYVGSSGQLVISTKAGSDAHQFIDLYSASTNYGIIIRESDGTGTAAFANLFVTDAVSNYLSIVIGATVNTNALNIMASNAIGIGGLPIASAKLDVQSTTGAFLPPRMTGAQRNALTAANGMIIFNTDSNNFEGYNGSWVQLNA